ncbi:MAG: tetratricopeptide repeat protein [Candidatus Hodarchaeota archaeon]
MSDTVSESLISVNQLGAEGKFRHALQILEVVEKSPDITFKDLLAIQLLKSSLLNKAERYNEALILAKQILENLKDQNLDLATIDALISKAEALLHLEELTESLDTITQGERALEPLGLDQTPDYIVRKTLLTNIKGEISWFQGALDQSLEYFEKSIALGRKINNKELIANTFAHIGRTYWAKGKLNWALEYFQLGLQFFIELESKYYIAITQNNLGGIYLARGELNRALECFQQCLIYFEKIDNKKYIAGCLNNISYIYRLKGELDQALIHLQQNLALCKDNNDTQLIASAFVNIGLIYQAKGELKRALEYFKRGLRLWKKINNQFDIIKVLLSIIIVELEQEAYKQAQRYLILLQAISDQEENDIIKQYCRLAEALVLKANPRPKTKLKAEKIFEELASEEILTPELTVIAILNLCDLLIYELKVSGALEILEEIHQQIKRLLKIASQQQSYTLLTQTIWLQSQLALLELDITKALQLLVQAYDTAIERGLTQLALIIRKEQDYLYRQLQEWSLISKKDVPLLERLHRTRLEELIPLIEKKRVEHYFIQVHNIQLTNEDIEDFVGVLDQRYSW